MTIPAEVVDVTRRHTAAVDHEAPGLLTGLYLIGSVALGDFRPEWSDIDFVATLERVPTDRDLAILAKIHARLDSPRPYDGVYLARSALARPSESQWAPRTYAHTHDGAFHVDRPDDRLSPVTQLELVRYGVPVRGPSSAGIGAPDPAQLRTWLLDNLTIYWMSVADFVDASIQDRPSESPTFGDSVSMIVLGPPRLHFTLATGAITSKSRAVDHIAKFFPAWTELAERCRRHRHGADPGFTIADMHDAIHLARRIRTDAETRWRATHR